MKKIIFLAMIVVAGIIIINISISIYTLWHKQDILIHAQKELALQRKENTQLKEQLSRMQNPQFVEEEARNKLFLIKPGESSVIIPQNLLQPTVVPTKKVSTQPIWQQWLALFFE